MSCYGQHRRSDCLLGSTRRGSYHAIGAIALIFLWQVVANAASPVLVKRQVSLIDLLGDDAPLAARNSDAEVDLTGTKVATEMHGDLAVMSVSTRRVLRNLGQGFLPVWSPSGRELAFYSRRSGDIQLWVWDDTRKTLKRITHIRGGIDPDPMTRVTGNLDDSMRFSWSPDGTRIVFGTRPPVGARQWPATSALRKYQGQGNTAEGPLVLTNTTPESWMVAGVFSFTKMLNSGRAIPAMLGNQLMVVSVKGGVLEQLTGGDRSWFHPAWSEDGTWILCASISGTSLTPSTASGQIDLVNVASRKVRVLVRGRGLKYRPEWTQSGSEIAYLALSSLFGWPRLYLIDSRSSRVNPVVVPFGSRYVMGFWSMPQGGRLLIRYRDGPSTRIGEMNIQSGALRPLRGATEDVPWTVGAVSVSRSGMIVWQQNDPAELSTIRYITPPYGRVRVLVHLDKMGGDFALAQERTIQWRDQSGVVRQGAILLPVGFEAGQKYPMILDAYPAMPDGDWTAPLFGNFAWAAAGYLVFRPSPRAPHAWMDPWTTEGSSADAKGPKGWVMTLDDVMSGVSELVREGLVDPRRMCAYGFSNGGAVVNYLITRTHAFACAVVVSPALTDWVSNALLYPGFTETAEGHPMYHHVADYVALSPPFHLTGVSTPLLLAAGDHDGSVLNAIEMYSGLRYLGKPVTLLRYSNETHVLSVDAVRDFWPREMAFFRTYLSPGSMSGNVLGDSETDTRKPDVGPVAKRWIQ